MTLIIILILLGIFLLGVEIFLLPGITIAAIGALASCGFGVYRAFDQYGTTGGLIALGAVLILSLIVISVGLRAKTWKRFMLKNKIDGTSQSEPSDQNVKIGDRGMTITRLAPIGKVSVGGKTYEAKSIDVYIDQRREVEVTGFENYNIVVKLIENN